MTKLTKAINSNNENLLEELLRSGNCNINGTNCGPLKTAIRRHRNLAISMLLDYGAIVNNESIQAAIDYNNIDSIDDQNLMKLLNKCNELDNNIINKVLQNAVRNHRSFDLINSLINSNSYQPRNEVILDSITYNSSTDIINLLIQNADLNTDSQNRIIIMAICRGCDITVIKHLTSKYKMIVDEVITIAVKHIASEELLCKLLEKNNNISNKTIAESISSNMNLTEHFISLLLSKCSTVKIHSILDAIRFKKSDNLIEMLLGKCNHVNSQELTQAIEFKAENNQLSDERMRRIINLCTDIHCDALNASLRLSDELISLIIIKCSTVKIHSVLDAIRFKKSDNLIEMLLGKCNHVDSQELTQAIEFKAENNQLSDERMRRIINLCTDIHCDALDVSLNLSDELLSFIINKSTSQISETIVRHALEKHLSDSLLKLLINRCQAFTVETIRISIQMNTTKEIILLLLNKCKHKNNTDTEGNNLLVAAISNNRFDLTEEFINAGIDINHKNFFSYSPIEFAINLQRLEFIRLLIKKGADINNLRESTRDFAERIGLNLDNFLITES